jgi:TetR/AcrR family transcriptional regulator, lmrAB and yxaGH operons repressor
VADREKTVTALIELFRLRGYEGASLSAITAATGLGKGSLYTLFPRGKVEMAEAALATIDAWFERVVFAPLRTLPPAQGVAAMLDGVDGCFASGQKVCLVGVVALSGARDRFAAPVSGYFAAWIAALAGALGRAGLNQAQAHDQAEAAVAAIQGGLVLARAAGDSAAFGRTLARLRTSLEIACAEAGGRAI